MQPNAMSCTPQIASHNQWCKCTCWKNLFQGPHPKLSGGPCSRPTVSLLLNWNIFHLPQLLSPMWLATWLASPIWQANKAATPRYSAKYMLKIMLLNIKSTCRNIRILMLISVYTWKQVWQDHNLWAARQHVYILQCIVQISRVFPNRNQIVNCAQSVVLI